MSDVQLYEVWTLPAGPGFFTWSDAWAREPRLISARYSLAPGAMGTASIRVLREFRRDQGDTMEMPRPGNVQAGHWVVITAGNPDGALVTANIKWFGFIDTITWTSTGAGDYIGQAAALGIGHLFDRDILTGFRRVGIDGQPEETDEPGTFNLGGVGSVVIGNRQTVSGNECIARDPAQCGTDAADYFTRKRLIDYIIRWLIPAGIPAFTAEYGPANGSQPSVEDALNSTTDVEVYDLRGLTLKGAIDLLIPRARGYGWDIIPSSDLLGSSPLKLVAYAVLSDAYGTLVPTQAKEDISLGSDQLCKEIVFQDEDGPRYDAVEVVGGQILFGFSLAASDGQWAGLWTNDQLTAWKAGSTATLPTYTDEQNASAVVREGPALRDVFVRYGITGVANDAVIVSPDPGVTAADSVLAFPRVDWDGSTVSLLTTESKDPAWTLATVEQVIPWPLGVSGDGTDSRTDAAKAAPEYTPPRVFVYDADADAGDRWRDLLVDEAALSGPSRSGASVQADARSAALNIRCSPPEWLAAGDWTSITAPRIGTESTPPDLAKDWRDMVVSIGVRSSQRLYVGVARAGVPDNAIRRRLVLRDDELQAWYVHAGTVVGIKPDGTSDRVTTGTWVRNDYPTAEQRAQLAASWALSDRASCVISYARPDSLPSWARIGHMIGTVTDDANARVTNSVVESIEVTITESEASAVIQTDRADGSAIASSLSPTGGGPVSLALGGTVAQAVASLQADQQATQRKVDAMPLLPPRVPATTSGGGTAHVTLAIIGGNADDIASGLEGIQYASAPLSLTQSYDPDVDVVYPAGLGRAWLYVEGALAPARVLVRHLFAAFPHPVPAGRLVRSVGTVSLPWDDGVDTGTIQAHIFDWV